VACSQAPMQEPEVERLSQTMELRTSISASIPAKMAPPFMSQVLSTMVQLSR
jgi:hypothetical protein